MNSTGNINPNEIDLKKENKINNNGYSCVTGATGHLGVALCKYLSGKNSKFKALVRDENKCDFLKPYVTDFAIGDVLDLESLVKAFTGCDTVYHFAGIITIGAENKKELNEVNITGTKNVIEACRIAKVKTLVYSSTAHTVPYKTKTEIIKETLNYDPKKVKGAYSKVKAIASQLVVDANDSDLKTVLILPTGVIGAYGYRLSNLGQMVISYSNNKIRVYIKGDYNFVDVMDVVKASVVAAEKGKGGESYILSGENVSVKKMFEYLSEVNGIKPPKIKIPLPIVRIFAPFMSLYYKICGQKPLFTPTAISILNSNGNFDNSKAKQELDFDPIPAKESLHSEYEFLLQAKRESFRKI